MSIRLPPSWCQQQPQQNCIYTTDCFCYLTASFYCYAFDFTLFCYFLICILFTVARSCLIVVHNSLFFSTILSLDCVCNALQVTLPFLRFQFTFYCFMNLFCLLVLFFFDFIFIFAQSRTVVELCMQQLCVDWCASVDTSENFLTSLRGAGRLDFALVCLIVQNSRLKGSKIYENRVS